MKNEIISAATTAAFRDAMAECDAGYIEGLFAAADIPRAVNHRPSVIGARRHIIEQYFHSIDFMQWDQVRLVLPVLAQVIEDREQNLYHCSGTGFDRAEALIVGLKAALRRDGFECVDGMIRRVPARTALPALKAVAVTLDATYLHQQIERMTNAVEIDPWLAVGTAKELIETTCRTILEERRHAWDNNWAVPSLVKETARVLKLAPDDIPDSAVAVDTIRRLLSNLAAVAHGLAELRNRYGTGHGHHASKKGLQPRHARLAVGAAATLAAFLHETHTERSS